MMDRLGPIQAPTGEAEQRLDGRVLVADDNEANRKICGMFCDLLGLSCEYASDGAEALELVRRGTFDLVLMDIHMPGMDGLEAAIAIRRLAAPICDTPIVAVTTAAESADIARYRACGVSDVVSKPIVASRLIGAITTALVSAPAEPRSWRPLAGGGG